ncbi:stanniocalcin-2 [Microcaecilia unicolor]|uniref:Stanniocalcin-2 n=1 Tax=Microcaecilia unicolor TaxID=1415580 RepID=A0A6P7YLH0_9AMPH|nr:stanniocalcin-2 [Microcaecilia unicolor]
MKPELLCKLITLALVLASFESALGTEVTDLPEVPQERDKIVAQQKGRLSLQNSVEIQHCLVNAGDVGCGVFECFENNSCEIRGLHEICMTFLHNAGKFDAQGKSFIKDALKCKAHGLRHKFSCISRKCPAIKEMVFQLQRECYLKYNLCSAAKENVQVIVEMIHFKDLLLHEPYVDLVNILLTCGDEVKEAITKSVQAQCEQNWGSLCYILSFCSSAVQGEPMMTGTLVPERRYGEESKTSESNREPSAQLENEREASKSTREDKEKGLLVPTNVHARVKAGSQGSIVIPGSSDHVDEPAAFSDIRR